MKYRSEDIYGEKHTDAVSVIVHEMFELGNIDIPFTLRKGILHGTIEGEELSNLVSYIMGETDLETLNDREYAAVYQYTCNGNDELLKEFIGHILAKVQDITGIEVKHVLWMCDSIQDVADVYGQNISKLEVSGYDEIDSTTGKGVILADLGKDGKLYGFTTLPKEKKRWIRTNIRYNLWEEQIVK